MEEEESNKTVEADKENDQSESHDEIESNENMSESHDDISQLTKKMSRHSIASHGSSARYIVIEGHKILRKQYEKLYDYQKYGIEFLLKKFNEKQFRGCILADDMG